jgi:hypothetical protein
MLTFCGRDEIEPSTFRPVSPTLYQLSYPDRQKDVLLGHDDIIIISSSSSIIIVVVVVVVVECK